MTRSQATPASSQIIALECMVQRLEQQVAAQQARIAELREALHYTLQAWHYDGISDEHGSTYAEADRRCDKPDDLFALEAAKRQARREALMEAAGVCLRFSSRGMSPAECAACITSMAEEVK